jgi:uncharacterized glyoxalase superfamily protein PhnB
MAKLTGHAPILLVKDVVAAANYWRDCVGFSYERFWGDPPGFCILNRDKLHLMLSQVKDAADILPHWQIVQQMWNVYFWVDDAKALHDELVQRGAKIDYGLETKFYGCLEFGIQDLEGHDIAFGQVVS